MNQPASPGTFRLLQKSRAAGCAAKIPAQELSGLLAQLPPDPHAPGRLLTSGSSNEDAAVLLAPQGKALVQTLDFFPPVVNDPYTFGQIAAANALSDIYAMGGEPWCAMNIVCFPARDLPKEVLSAILRGGADKLAEAGAVLAGGHSVDDPEIKYGMAVSGFVDPASFAANTGLVPGQQLMLTKALGTGILATAVKAEWLGHEQMERDLAASAVRLNAGPSRVIRELGLRAATDITGFGLGGHLLEMAAASRVNIYIDTGALPALPGALEMASMGFVPAGSHANKRFRKDETHIGPEADPLRIDLVFDAQTSGGIVLALAPEQVSTARAMLEDNGDMAVLIGEVHPSQNGPKLFLL